MKSIPVIHIPLCAFAMTLGCLLATAAQAEISSTNVCTRAGGNLNLPPQLSLDEVCYSGFSCDVGLRGDWLDFTNEVIADSVGRSGAAHPVEASARIALTGDENPRFICVKPSGKAREGYVLVSITDLTGHGRMRVAANRPGPLGVGVHSDHYDVEVRDGSRYLDPYPKNPLSARVGQLKTIEITGIGVNGIRIRQRPLQVANASKATNPIASRIVSATPSLRTPMNAQQLATLQKAVPIQPFTTTQASNVQAAATPEVAILGKTQILLRLQVKFDRQGIYSLGDYLEFAAGDPPINKDMGWPTIDVKP